ncbi:hypothetical protein D9615_001587 [Tricholomella constricta]|uniref:S-adenosyl-L-methionine-dependent methyltransferase n=1 Tax=Tricholomella constricta TaxID=117010 RepID=A0A8H5MAW1_9AGAR|nr:hypothetical protein D9615_001587 [Tricholomella constricta]
MSTPLSALSNIISSHVQTLEAAYAKAGAEFPSLDDPFHPTPLDFDPALHQTKALIVAAAAQILATVRSPIEMLQEYSPGMYWTATLGFVVDTNIPDILNEGGPQGVHVKDISAQNGVDPSYIARILRFLATRHVFREVTPDVFANNRISSLLSKSKSVKEIKADPVARFDEAPLAGFISSSADEALKSSVHFSEFLQNPIKAAAAFNIALKTEAKMWEWYEEPGNEWREIFVNGIGCKDLKDGDVVVDVGGSVGSCVLHLFKEYPNLHYVVQDLPKQITAAAEFWQENAPEAVPSGKVTLQAHNFFTPQPVKGAAVYFLRVVIHDWPDRDAKTILQHLRDAADTYSKLIIFDTLAFHVCEDPATESAAPKAPVPRPLLANLGIAGAGFETGLDIQMINLFNGKERTEAEFRELGLSVGWKLESITRGPLPAFVFSAV